MNREYDELLDNNWEDSVPNFLLWVEVACGIEKDSDLFCTLKQHVTSEDELDTWIDYFVDEGDGDKEKIEAVTESYLASKFKAA